MSKQSKWMPTEIMDRDKMQFVLVTEDGAVRLQSWNPLGYFELAFPVGVKGDIQYPTHWMPCPKLPLSELSKGEVKG